jgi:ADP-heptose:LPS heptosyltransferase
MQRKIVFRHSRAPGDVLMFSAGVRDFKALFPDIAINVESRFPELWDNNPHLDRSLTRNDSDVEFYEVGYPTIQGCNDGFIHFSQSFLLNMISQVDARERLPISLGEFCASFAGGRTVDLDPNKEDSDFSGSNSDEVSLLRGWRDKYREFTSAAYRAYGDIHLSDEEKRVNTIRESYDVSRYWVIAPGGKRDCTCKVWDWRKFQRVVDHFDGFITFVTIGRSDHLIEPLRGVISMVDKTPNLRGLIQLAYHADGCVSGVSFLMHLAGAMPPKDGKGRKPCVAIYGGREPGIYTWYTNHQILHTNGALECCDNGGCWQSRVTEIAKDADINRRMCHQTVVRDGRTVQKCMDMISAEDVIRAIERYYDGGRLRYLKKNTPKAAPRVELRERALPATGQREINMLASLKSSGGGEQSALKIADVLIKAGWKVNFYSWAEIHRNYEPLCKGVLSFRSGEMAARMKPGLPLLFYGNDQIWDFCKIEQTAEIIEKSSSVIVGINFANGDLPQCSWLARSKKVAAIVFQNHEKAEEFRRDAIGFEDTRLITLFGAIDLDTYYEIPSPRRASDEELVVLKHCKPDGRKYVTSSSEGNGKKVHLWQKHFFKERDTKFYQRLLNDCKFPIRFEFMEAHSELEEYFAGEERMVFHKWDSMPVTDFLRRGHVYLYRTSNQWRDQYPRCVAEALAVGMPILTEPRDGTHDRVEHGDTGMYCCDYDAFRLHLNAYHRKEDFRFKTGLNAKEWAKKNLDPKRWVDTIESILETKP